MARLNRLVVAGQAHHVGLLSVAGVEPLAGNDEPTMFIDALRRSAGEHAVVIHAYVLLKDEVMLLATPATGDGLGRMVQALTRFYVGPFNRRHGRAGALWQSRFRAAPVGGADELLSCMRFIEQAPRRRHGVLGALAEYPWSSAAHHVGARAESWLAGAPHGSAYWRLGNTPFEREAAYRDLLEEPLSRVEAERVSASTLKGWALGSGEFIASLATEAPRRVAARPRGRPPKKI